MPYKKKSLIEGYVTVNEIVGKWEIILRMIQIMYAEGRIKCATKFGLSWAVPIDAERPKDGKLIF